MHGFGAGVAVYAWQPAAVSVAQAGVPWLARMGTPAPKPVSYIPYDIPLRPGRVHARLVLPVDLTADEGERLCGVIRAVAFPVTLPALPRV